MSFEDKLRYTIVVVLLIYCAFRFLTNCRREHPNRALMRRYRFAHRGFHHKPEVPENSIPAFWEAVENDFGAEFDVHLMKDGNLAVIHDSNLQRVCGVDVRIEDLTKEDLANYTLEGTEEHIPLMEDVLDIFGSHCPVIIELKTVDGNAKALCEAVTKQLDEFHGTFGVESFDPEVLRWYRKYRYNFFRGQLSQNFFKEPAAKKLTFWQKFCMTNLWTNILTLPDFVAYKYEDRSNFWLGRCKKWHNAQVVYWTITKKDDLRAAEAKGAIPIFEQFDPDED